MAKNISKKQFDELKKIVEQRGIDFEKFRRSSEEYREQAMRDGYQAFREKFPEVYGLPVEDPTPDNGGGGGETPPGPLADKDKFGIPFLHKSKPVGFFYEMSDDPQNDVAMDHVDKEFTVRNGVITMMPQGPTSFGVGKNIRSFEDSIGGCKMNFKETAIRGFAFRPDDVRDMEYKVLTSIKNIGDHGMSISVCTGHHDSGGSFKHGKDTVCCQGCAYMFNLDTQGKPMKMRFEKEQWHVNYVTSPEGWFTHPQLNFKPDGHGYFGICICRYNKPVDNNPEHDHVVLEAWVCPNPEEDLTNWIMVKRIEDYTGRGWGDKGDYCPGGAKDNAITWSNAQNRLKTNAESGSIDFKCLSFREIISDLA